MTRKKLSTIFLSLGVVFLVATAAIWAYQNMREDQLEEFANNVVPELAQAMQEQPAQDPGEASGPSPVTPPDPDSTYDPEMLVREVDGQPYIGYLSIPDLGLNLPLLAEWDYERLEIAPCRYTGSAKTNDLIIAGHNYRKHFGYLKRLKVGAKITLFDMAGTVWMYEVERFETLPSIAIEQMQSGDWDLSLFTCTIGGKSRLTLRCRLSAALPYAEWEEMAG